jgi:GABA permease
MRNPLRSEAEAFRFVCLTIGYFALIVLGHEINNWVAAAVFVIETSAVIWWFATHGEMREPIKQVPAPHPAGERRILVVANETVAGGELLNEIRRRANGTRTSLLVVIPALNSQVKHWANDEDGARAAAQARLDASLAALHLAGLEANGEVGDDDPLQAIDDALRTFSPDELIISTHPEGRSNWLERDIVAHARERFALPVTHVVVDLEAERRLASGY